MIFGLPRTDRLTTVITGLTTPVVVNEAVRTIGTQDRDAIRACDDADALQELRAQLLTAKRGKWTRPIGASGLVITVIVVLLLVNGVSPVVIVILGMLLTCMGVMNMRYQARVRERAKHSDAWIDAVESRLLVLAANADD